MKLSEMNAMMDELKEQRAALWEQLDTVLADDTLTVANRKSAEAGIRKQIAALQAELYPLDMERSEIDRVVKGKPRKQAEAWVEEAITLG